MSTLYYKKDIECMKDNKKYSFTIQMRSIMSQNKDCKIGDFGSNIWYRTKKATQKGFNGYKNDNQMLKACKLSLLKYGYSNLLLVDNQTII